MNNFGETLKKLRKQKDMTQEQLAEYVNISPQSVSKWETNLTLPDITIIPILANIFDVSADVLLGIDITLKNERIEKIEKEASNYLFTGQYEEAEKILRGALKEYPNSYKLMGNLVLTLGNIASYDKAREKTLREEEIALGEKIFSECTDDKTRHRTIPMLCYTYCDADENEKAMDLVDKLPNTGISSDYLRGFILKGTKKFKHKQKVIANDMTSVLEEIISLYSIPLDGEEIATHKADEYAALDGKVIDIINILCEDGNVGSFSHQLSRAHLHLCDFCLERKNLADALKHLKLAAQNAILFDAKCRRDDDTEEYTSLLFRGMKFGNMRYIEPLSRSQDLLERIENGIYYRFFSTEELNAIKEEFRKYANPAV